tara:strand:+ start:4087 stop:4731 length:645 start_codon:yes stop_codon:yes gene_type:complete
MAKSPGTPKSFKIFNRDLNQETAKILGKNLTLAIDTEAMGLIHGRDRLCLVQICDSEDNVACIKIEKDQKSAPLLKELLELESIEKVFHFARFDVAALAEGLSINTTRIFCTKIGSKIARTYSPKHGLKELILELVDVELDKQSQSSDWGKIENLTEKQLAYAANDVRFLIEAKEKLKNMLMREGRLEIAEKCFNCIPTFTELDRKHYKNIFEH